MKYEAVILRPLRLPLIGATDLTSAEVAARKAIKDYGMAHGYHPKLLEVRPEGSEDQTNLPSPPAA